MADDVMRVEPGCKVRVVNPNHWLCDKVGHVVEMTHDALVKQSVAAGADPHLSIGVPVDFEKSMSGWSDGPFGRRKRITHNCDGALKHKTGYYILARELALVDVPGDSFRQRTAGGIIVPGI